MARLKQLAPRVGSLPMRGRSREARPALRDRIDTWRRWYKTADWRRLRWQVLVEAQFTCAMCGRVGDSPSLVADHITPHRGSRDLFWDRGNLQCLCSACHSSEKPREERGGRG